MKKNMKLLMVVTLISTLLVGCGQKPSEQKEEPKDEQKEEVVVPENQNLLTGLGDLTKEAIGKRPVAVMINNAPAAQPQYGNEQADILFELPVEADLTRMMGVYGDYTTVPKICPIRSCRYYYPILALSYDAFYVHWGSDESIIDYVDSLGVNRIDGMSNAGGLFGRDQDRINSGYALEHTGTFDGTRLANYIDSKGLRTDLKEDKTNTAFNFVDMDKEITPKDQDCTAVDIDFGAVSAQFTYDEPTNTYLKSFSNNKQIDAKTNNQLSFTNVFVLETLITLRGVGLTKDINWSGGPDAKGYYISNGSMQEIRWQKDGEHGDLKFYDVDGKELVVNRGKSYIAFNYANQTIFE